MTRILLTGGSGFMGKAIAAELLDQHCPFEVSMLRIFDVNKYTGPPDPRLEFLSGDVRDYRAVVGACLDIDLVIHSAAIVDWGTKSEEDVLSVNVEGTDNIIKACKEQNVKYLVYTSSLDAVFGGLPLVNIPDDIPYPETHPNSYCRSKYLAEKLVITCSADTPKACIIRPADVYGGGDPYHIGSLLQMAKGGFYIRLGNGKSKCQHVYVGNVAYAHVLAAKALMDNNPKINGNAYFITDGPSANFFSFYDSIIEASGYHIWPKNLWLPRNFAMFLGILSEGVAALLRPIKHYTPKMSRFAVTYTCSDFTFNSGKARNDFGFVPKYTAKEALETTVRYYQELKDQKK
jgi:sterol-4alpha-carboxylate 3-dehydrogenase (decarboxylating)